MNRARQGERHRDLKRQVAAELAECEFEVMFEFRLADVVGFHLRKGIILAVEIELSPRNVVGNLTRNLKNGFTRILIVAPDSDIDVIKRLIQPQLAGRDFEFSIEVTPSSDLHVGIASFVESISEDFSKKFSNDALEEREVDRGNEIEARIGPHHNPNQQVK